MKEFIAGLALVLLVGGIAIALETKEKGVKYIDANCD